MVLKNNNTYNLIAKSEVWFRHDLGDGVHVVVFVNAAGNVELIGYDDSDVEKEGDTPFVFSQTIYTKIGKAAVIKKGKKAAGLCK